MRTDRWLRAFALVAVLVAAALAMPSLALRAAAAELPLPVPRTTIYPGDTIGPDMLVERAFIAHTVARASVYEDQSVLIGKIARRTLLQGQPIPVNAIRDPFLITQGKGALVVFEAGGLVITSAATALQNGGLGDVITLRNDDSGTIIKGKVAADGSVRLSVP
jgi:flagella basal body P-ring formation protein FlgA